MRRLLLFALFAALLAAMLPAAVHAQAATPLRDAVAWLGTQQQPDGSFPGFGPGDSADAVIALVAAGEDPAGFVQDGKSPLDFLSAQASAYAANGAGAAAKLAMAVIAADGDPTSFGGVNLLELIGKGYDPATGQYGPDVFGHALSLLAIKAAGATPPPLAIERLLSLQLDDGGWSFDGTAASGSDTNTTSLALQALAGQSQGQSAIADALTYLRGQQNADGGFPYSQTSQFGNATDANSTAAVIMALVALGENPAAFTNAGKGPIDALATLQNDSGALRYQAAQADDNALATYQAIPALAGASLPVATARINGAQTLIAPTAAGLPATGSADSAPLTTLALAALALCLAGGFVRRRG